MSELRPQSPARDRPTFIEALTNPSGSKRGKVQIPEGGIPMRATMPLPDYPQQITVSAGTAFKFGFYAFWGFLVAAVVPWVILVFVLGFGLAALRGH